METVQRLVLTEGLTELYRYGFGQSPYSAICVFGHQVAEWLNSNEGQTEVSSAGFVRAYVLTLETFLKEDVDLCIDDYGNLAVARENLTAQMWNIAEELVSKKFSEEAFAVFQDFLKALLKSRSCPTSIN